MPVKNRVIQAYRAASSYKSQREIEADIFRQAIDSLLAAGGAEPVQQVKAVADNRRLWMAVQAIITDPENALPMELRASIISISLSIQREMNRENPNLDFLVAMNENMVSGLLN